MAQPVGSPNTTHSASDDESKGGRVIEGINNISLADKSAIKHDPDAARPTHFLLRGNLLTPLIALDELPKQLKISDLSQYYSIDEVSELGGIPILGMFKKAANSYYVEIDDDDNASTHTATESAKFTAYDANMVPSNATLNDRLARCFEGVGTAPDPEKLKQSILNLKNTSKFVKSKQAYNPTTPGVLGEKVYCTHWMRTGECDFTQQGCMFLHYMPDLPTLELLGFRSYPRWFREMPRQFQVSNAKDFSEEGLSGGRGQVPIDRGHNSMRKGGGNRYAPARNPYAGSVHHGGSQPPQFNLGNMVHADNGSHRFLPSPGPWLEGSPHLSSASVHGQQSFAAGAPQHSYRDIWSLASSPTMAPFNQAHKPLVPHVRSQPGSYAQAIIGTPFSQFPTPASTYSQVAAANPGSAPAMATLDQPSNGPAPRRNTGSRGGAANANNGRGGRGGNRGGKKSSPKDKNKNPFGVLSVDSTPEKDSGSSSDQSNGQKK